MSHLLIRIHMEVQRSMNGWGPFEVLSGANAGFGQFLTSSNSSFLNTCAFLVMPSPKMWGLPPESRGRQSVYVVLADCDRRYWAHRLHFQQLWHIGGVASPWFEEQGPLASPEQSPSPEILCVITEQEAWSLPCGLIGLAFWKSPLLVKYINDSFRPVFHPGRALCKVPQIS